MNRYHSSLKIFHYFFRPATLRPAPPSCIWTRWEGLLFRPAPPPPPHPCTVHPRRAIEGVCSLPTHSRVYYPCLLSIYLYPSRPYEDLALMNIYESNTVNQMNSKPVPSRTPIAKPDNKHRCSDHQCIGTFNPSSLVSHLSMPSPFLLNYQPFTLQAGMNAMLSSLAATISIIFSVFGLTRPHKDGPNRTPDVWTLLPLECLHWKPESALYLQQPRISAPQLVFTFSFAPSC